MLQWLSSTDCNRKMDKMIGAMDYSLTKTNLKVEFLYVRDGDSIGHKPDHSKSCEQVRLLISIAEKKAQELGFVLGTRPSSAAQLQAIRNIMIMSIHTMDATQDSDEFSVLCYVLRAIVYEIEPIPLAATDLQTGLQVHESHRKRRRSSAG